MDVELIVNHKLDEGQLGGVDIVFINRLIPNTSLNDIIKLRERFGFKLIVDFDDHWDLDPDHYLFDTYKNLRISELMEAYLSEGDAFFVTHDRLYNEVKKFTDKVYILPNAIPKFDQFIINKTQSEFTRLFWAGGVTHKKDIQILTNPIKRFNFRNIQMVMGGYVENNPEYQAMASAFTNGGRINNNLIKVMPVDKYYYSYSECDIALVPLRDTKFNSYKSNLKILEAANVGAPVIVSNVHPYKDIPFVNYVNNQGDWYNHVKKVLDPDYRSFFENQVYGLQTYINENFNFKKINEERKQIFEYVTGKQAKVREIQGQVPAANVG